MAGESGSGWDQAKQTAKSAGKKGAKRLAKAAGKKVAARVAIWTAGTIGCGTIGIGLVVLLAVFVVFTFFYGLFTTTGGTIRVGPGEQMVGSASLVRANQALRDTYVKAADAVALAGLNASQRAQVESQQVDLPASVLLALGKVETDYHPTDAQVFASRLAPVYSWDRLYDLTCVTRSVHVGRGAGYRGGSWSIRRTLTRTPVEELATANTWDGTLLDTYRPQVSGRRGIPANGQVEAWHRTWVLASSVRRYSWTRVWSLLRAIPSTTGTHKVVLRKDRANREFLATLIAAQDSALADPYVQQQAQVLFGGAVGSLHLPGPVGVASGSAVQNVLRWESDIRLLARRDHVPAVLIAGVMAQESGGHEHDGFGGVLTSGAGAMGLMQVEPTTAAGMVGSMSVALADLSNGPTNLALGAQYLAELYHAFGNRPVAALAAYNAGPGAEEVALANGGTVPPYTQTLEYVATIQGEWVPAFSPTFGVE